MVTFIVPVFGFFGIFAHFVSRIVVLVLVLIIIVNRNFRDWFVVPSSRGISACRRLDFIVEWNCSPDIVGPDLLKRTTLPLSHFFAYRYTTIRGLQPPQADAETDASADKPLICSF
jgi:hypothetical protein